LETPITYWNESFGGADVSPAVFWTSSTSQQRGRDAGHSEHGLIQLSVTDVTYRAEEAGMPMLTKSVNEKSLCAGFRCAGS
jgi:hypothetical protein